MTANKGFPAPEHLEKGSKNLWKQVNSRYVLTDSQRAMLQVGLEARDRADDCKAAIDADGVVVLDRFGAAKAHPLLSSERDGRALFIQVMRKLNLHLPEEG